MEGLFSKSPYPCLLMGGEQYRGALKFHCDFGAGAELPPKVFSLGKASLLFDCDNVILCGAFGYHIFFCVRYLILKFYIENLRK